MTYNQDSNNGAFASAIIERLSACSAQMMILFDHDSLTLNTAAFERIVDAGYEVYDYTDNLSLFFYLESQIKSNPKDRRSKLIIRISANLADIARLPYAVIINAHRIELRLEDFFVGLNAKAVKELPDQYYHKLFDLLQTDPQELGTYDKSTEFITRRIFVVDPAGINNETQFWAVLFKLHYNGTELPGFVINKLHDIGVGFVKDYELDLELALLSSEYFFAFLQKEWSRYINSQLSTGSTTKVLKFDQPELKVYTDNFFAEGMLKRVKLDAARGEEWGWIRCGIELKTPDLNEQITSLMSIVQTRLPESDSSHRDWQRFMKHYAEFLYKLFSAEQSQISEDTQKLRVYANDRFLTWVQKRYDSLSNLPATKPVMVHHIAKSMAYHIKGTESSKVVLIVMDGMSCDQWLCIRAELDLSGFDLSEDVLFAGLPTLTSISRQSIFAATIPLFFGQHLGNTSREEGHWKRFWENVGLNARYLRIDGTGEIASSLENQVNLKSDTVLGIVLSVVDNIMHGMKLGSAGMHNQIRYWMKQGHFISLIKLLIDHDFEVWITADHGNLECDGIGSIPDGSLSETKASRVRIYKSEALRDKAASQVKKSLVWTPKGLPNDLFCLFAPYRASYNIAGRNTVTHGGISLEEVMVPFVKIKRKSK